MKFTKQQLERIFAEWSKRSTESPDAFESIRDDDGNVIDKYGKASAEYFVSIASDLGFLTE